MPERQFILIEYYITDSRKMSLLAQLTQIAAQLRKALDFSFRILTKSHKSLYKFSSKFAVIHYFREIFTFPFAVSRRKKSERQKRQFICGPKQKSRISSPAHYINFVCYFAVILLLVSDISAVQTQKQPRYNSAPSS